MHNLRGSKVAVSMGEAAKSCLFQGVERCSDAGKRGTL